MSSEHFKDDSIHREVWAEGDKSDQIYIHKNLSFFNSGRYKSHHDWYESSSALQWSDCYLLPGWFQMNQQVKLLKGNNTLHDTPSGTENAVNNINDLDLCNIFEDQWSWPGGKS